LRCGHNGLEAVINPEKNDFIYFCASVERFGYHEFAATLKEHNVNAKNIGLDYCPRRKR
jgi:cell division protein YceG involved in septum cleavage